MNEKDENIHDVLNEVAKLAPHGEEAPEPAVKAYARFKSRVEAQKRSTVSGRSNGMFRNRYAQTAFAVLLLLVIAFSFPSVRAAASDFLGLFRVQKFAAISISPEQLALLEELAKSGLSPGEIVMLDEPGEPRLVDSIAEAEAAAGRDLRVPTGLGDPSSILVSDGGSGRLIIDVTSAKAILAAAGADPTLITDSLDGENVDVTVFPIVNLNWPDGVMMMQTASPLVDYPDDVDPQALGQALLQVLGMSESEARALAQEIVWTDTLLLPIPENAASFREVALDGGSMGIALTSLQGDHAGVLWQRDGIVYTLSGADIDYLIEIANFLE